MGCGCGGRIKFGNHKQSIAAMFTYNAVYFNKGVYEFMADIIHGLVGAVHKGLRIMTLDSAGENGVFFRYRALVPSVGTPGERMLGDFRFQEGDAGSQINGLSDEILLVIIKDRLESLTDGSIHNVAALGGVGVAIQALQNKVKELEGLE